MWLCDKIDRCGLDSYMFDEYNQLDIPKLKPHTTHDAGRENQNSGAMAIGW